jgi:hypothetical protein
MAGRPDDREALRDSGEDFLRQTGMNDVVRHVGQMGRATRAGHRGLRRMERGESLGVDVGQADQGRAEREFALARRHAQSARQLVQTQRGRSEWKSLDKQFNERREDPELQSVFAEARERWITAILEADVPAGDAAEIAAAWDETHNHLLNNGLDSLLDRLDKQLSEFQDELAESTNWGRRPHSPLEWWEWLLIILVVGVLIAVLLECFFWAGCSWIYAIFVGICAGASPAGGWIFEICLTILF